MNQPAPEYPSDGTQAEDVPQPAGVPTGDAPEQVRAEQRGMPYSDDTSDGTTAPRASDVASAEDLEPADDTPAEQGDDTAVDELGDDAGNPVEHEAGVEQA